MKAKLKRASVCVFLLGMAFFCSFNHQRMPPQKVNEKELFDILGKPVDTIKNNGFYIERKKGKTRKLIINK